MKRNSPAGETLSQAVTYIIFILISFLVFYPLVYTVSGAFSPGHGIAAMNIIPFKDGFTVKHFSYLFTQTQYWLWFSNTLVIALWTTVLTVIISSVSAYVFSRFKFVFKKSLMMSLLILQHLPQPRQSDVHAGRHLHHLDHGAAAHRGMAAGERG